MLLSICIPTYNRASQLSQCLLSIVNQTIFLNSDEVEIVILDNCSTDETEAICQKYVEKYQNKIKYIRQEKNIGADLNIATIFNFANGKFAKLNNDTAKLKAGALEYMLNAIKNNTNNAIIFFSNQESEKTLEFIQYKHINNFVENISFYSTWIGSLCINVDYFKSMENRLEEINTKLPQVDWILSTLRDSKTILVVNKHIIDGLPVNQKGGYNIAEIFGHNYSYLLRKYVKTGDLSNNIFKKERKNILYNHIINYYFDFEKQWAFDKGNYFYHMRDCWFNLFFYLSFFKILKKYHKYKKNKRKIRKRSELEFFQYHWKLSNEHNNIIPQTVFNKDIVTVGNYSYGPLNVLSWGQKEEKLTIGNFVSIANNVKFLLGGNHPYESFSTYPFKVLFWGEATEAQTKGAIIIEDDVWIGENALILSGVKIGQGAIIAAGSVVTKDVEPYSIVGGNPAKFIKYRFDKEVIEQLMDFDFSNLTKENINNDINLLHTHLNKDNVKSILAKIKENK